MENQPITQKNSQKAVAKNNQRYKSGRAKANARKRKFVDNMTPEDKEKKRSKDREYYQNKKAAKVKIILSDRDKRMQRKNWRLASQKYRNKNKNKKSADNVNTDAANLSSGSVQKTRGRKISRKDRAKAYRTIVKKNETINKLQRKVESMKKTIKKQESNQTNQRSLPNETLTPNSKVNDLLKNVEVTPEIRRRLLFGEVLSTQLAKNAKLLRQNSKEKEIFHKCLCYSGQKCYRIPEALVKMYGTTVHSLDLSYNELVSLRGLEGFSLLRILILDNNQLTDSLVLPYMPHLHTLSLNKNCIIDLELMITKIVHNLPRIIFLSLLGNKACPNQLSDIDKDEEDYQRYRYYVLHHLPKLKFLDSTPVQESERAEARVRGQYMKIVRPREHDKKKIQETPILCSLTALPRQVRKPDDHRGGYEKCKYRYSGKHSEGNRFICNNDL